MKINVKRFDVWIADLNPRIGTEPGKRLPVVVIQSNLLNEVHPSALICPITTNVQKDTEILRVTLSKNEAGLKVKSAILVDHVRAIDNARFVKRTGTINEDSRLRLIENLKIILDIDL